MGVCINVANEFFMLMVVHGLDRRMCSRGLKFTRKFYHNTNNFRENLDQ